MANTILLKRSSTPSSVPTTSNLSLGELAINTYDGAIYFKKSVTGVDSIVTVSPYSLNNNGHSLILHDDATVEFPNFTFPANDGTANQFLVTDGAGNLSWSSNLNLDNIYIKNEIGVGSNSSIPIYAVTVFIDPLTSLEAIEIQTTVDHGLVDGQYVSVYGVQGTEEINNISAYVKVVSTDTFDLYSDELLTTLYANGSGLPFQTWLGGGYVSTGHLKFSDSRIQHTRAPRYWTNNSAFPPAGPDLQPGDFYYDDSTDSLYVWQKYTPTDGSPTYYDFKDITVRNA